MHEQILFIFLPFLLVTVLLLLLVADAREKSRRLRVLVTVSGGPDEAATQSGLKSFLRILATETELLFILHDKNAVPDAPPSGFRIFLHIDFRLEPGAENEISPDTGNPGSLMLRANSADALAQDPDFINRVAVCLQQAAVAG